MGRKAPQSLRSMQTKHLTCRNFAHPWEPKRTSSETVDRRRAWVIYLRCTRCTATCKEIYFPTSGDRKRSGITYPEGYTVENLKQWGGRKILNDNVRRELFGRLMNGRK
jgi:hypothetical protein